MEREQLDKYMEALANAMQLVLGPRDEDYNKGGIGLRDYWKVNGIRSPLQMVDMKVKRALSQVAGWDTEQMGSDMPIPTSRAQVDKLNESMLDLINYAAFVICEAESLFEEHIQQEKKTEFEFAIALKVRLQEAVKLWRSDR